MEAILKDDASGVGASHVLVLDKSGGCGAMYEVRVVSAAFEKKPMVQQHRKVTQGLSLSLSLYPSALVYLMVPLTPPLPPCSLSQALAEQIKDMHGLQIYTWAPKKFEGLSEAKRAEIFAVPEGE